MNGKKIAAAEIYVHSSGNYFHWKINSNIPRGERERLRTQ